MRLAGEILVAVVLVVGAAAKLADPASAEALSAFGAARPGLRRGVWAATIVCELGLAATLIAGIHTALLGAAALFGAFALALVLAIRAGKAGQPCGCFGRRGRITGVAAARNAGLSAVSLGLFFAPGLDISERTAVIAGFAVLGAAVLALTVAVVALAREIGVLRLAAQSRGALEIEGEGPQVGSHMDLAPWFEGGTHDMALAAFVSEGCPVCATLGPSLDFLSNDPWLAVRVFDEERDREAWRAFAVPGAPYAVALDASGRVLAKGICNSLPQLESVVATAARRREELVGV